MFSALATFGLLLAAATKFKRWVWLGLEMAVLGGVLFALWLFWVSLYKIHALCPYCLGTDVAVYAMAWYVTLFNIEQGYILKNKRFDKLKAFSRKHHLGIFIGLILLLATFILHHFWFYYGRNF